MHLLLPSPPRPAPALPCLHPCLPRCFPSPHLLLPCAAPGPPPLSRGTCPAPHLRLAHVYAAGVKGAAGGQHVLRHAAPRLLGQVGEDVHVGGGVKALQGPALHTGQGSSSLAEPLAGLNTREPTGWLLMEQVCSATEQKKGVSSSHGRMPNRSECTTHWIPPPFPIHIGLRGPRSKCTAEGKPDPPPPPAQILHAHTFGPSGTLSHCLTPPTPTPAPTCRHRCALSPVMCSWMPCSAAINM